MSKNFWFTIGKVTGVHGLNGSLKVWSYARSVDTFRPGTKVLLKSGTGQESDKPYIILKAQPHKKGILLFLEGIDNRELAENLKDYEILINREYLDEPEEGTWYWQDLLGLDVFENTKGFLGKIENLFPTGAHDMLVVKDKDKETLIPMHKHFVESVDIENNKMNVILPEEYC